MEKRKKTAKRWLVIAILLMLVGMIGASLVQSNFGKVAVKDVRWESTMGHRMSGLLFVPEGASAEKPAPAVVVSHGMYNNREMQDLNFVELSRRGYVVLSMDMLNHGNSESAVDNSGEIVKGMYEAVKMMATLPYVDTSRIGITGHSLGGMSSNMAVVLDNAAVEQGGEQLIGAVLLNCADATYMDSETMEYSNLYGGRDVGIIAAKYDEWFFRQDDGNGGETAPRDFINNSNAQSFLHFAANPTTMDMRVADTVYTANIEGVEAMRVVYTPAIIHPWSHFSQQSTQFTIGFFEQALGAPAPLAATSQIWQVKVLFNLLGLIGFGIFVVCFAIVMVFTPFFSSLRAKEVAGPVALKKGGAGWFWGSLAAGAAFGALVYLPLIKAVKGNVRARELFRQSAPWGIGMWAMVTGVFAIVSMVVSYRLYGKKNHFSLEARGVTLSKKNLGKTILLALITVTVSYGWIFFADYFFKTDFRFWTLALKAFEVDKFWVALFPSALLFLVYYLANAVATNCFNYNTIGKKEWVNTAVLAVFNALPPVILLLMQYIYFVITGHLLFASNMYVVWLFPMVVILPLAVIMSRKIYRVTKNPYLGGIINGLLVTLLSCSNTLTWK